MILIIGASGFIGKKLYLHLKKEGVNVKGTYCKNGSNLPKNERLYLNLEKGDFNEIIKLSGVSHVILCHGISNIEQCKREPNLSYIINVTNTINLLKYFKKLDSTPVYFSTSMVYNGKKEKPAESDETVPTTEYGKQKLVVEEYIRNTFDKYIILRLTKVFGVEKGDKTLFTSWVDRLINNEKIYAADDVFISPVFIMDVLKVLEILINGNHYGLYNMGGDKRMSIYDFAKNLAESFHFQYDLSLVQRVSINDFHFIEEHPKFNSVDSKKIKEITGVNLTSYEDCFKLIATNYGSVERLTAT